MTKLFALLAAIGVAFAAPAFAKDEVTNTTEKTIEKTKMEVEKTAEEAKDAAAKGDMAPAAGEMEKKHDDKAAH